MNTEYNNYSTVEKKMRHLNELLNKVLSKYSIDGLDGCGRKTYLTRSEALVLYVDMVFRDTELDAQAYKLLSGLSAKPSSVLNIISSNKCHYDKNDHIIEKPLHVDVLQYGFCVRRKKSWNTPYPVMLEYNDDEVVLIFEMLAVKLDKLACEDPDNIALKKYSANFINLKTNNQIRIYNFITHNEMGLTCGDFPYMVMVIKKVLDEHKIDYSKPRKRVVSSDGKVTFDWLYKQEAGVALNNKKHIDNWHRRNEIRGCSSAATPGDLEASRKRFREKFGRC